MKKILMAVIGAACAALSSFATDYYVGGENAADEAGHGTADAPFATITYALGKAKTAGDVVYVAEGTYTEAATLVVPAGVGLVALSSDRSATVIDGNSDKRCVQLAGAKAYIKGFTIRNGRLTGANNHGGGVLASVANAATIYCSFYNCRGERGGAANGGIYIGCYFHSDNEEYWSSSTVGKQAAGAYGTSYLINCIFNNVGGLCNSGKIINCTYVGSLSYIGTNMSSTPPSVYNTRIDTAVKENILAYNCASKMAVDDTKIKDQDSHCVYSKTTTIALTSAYYPETTATDLLAKGDVSYYNDNYPTDAAWAAYKNLDYYGNPRFTGTGDDATLDIGAVRYDWTDKTSKGYTTVMVDNGDDTTTFTFTRNDKPAKPLVTLTFGGETVNFDEQEAGYAFEVTVPTAETYAEPTVTYQETAITVYYVDAEAGSDNNRGYRADCPFASITNAVKYAKTSGDKVYVAEGTYVGGIAIPAGVGIEATGTRAETIIDGAGAKQAVSSMGALSYIKGFTIQNCYYSGSGGAIVAPSNAAVIDCWFFNNTAGYRGAAGTGGVWIRCYFDSTHTETSGGSGSPTTAKALYAPTACYNCVFNGQGSFGFTGVQYIACTFINPASVGPNGGSATMLNSIYYSTFNTVNMTVCKQESSPAKYLSATYTPKSTYTAVIGKADATAYAEAIADSAWAAYLDVDFNGLARTRTGDTGTMEIGACQYDWSKDAVFLKTTGVDITVNAAGTQVTFTRNYTSTKILKSLTFNGVTHDFETQGDTFVTAITGPLGDYAQPTATLETAMTYYVDATDGNDNNCGYTADRAFASITNAVKYATVSGMVVRVAAGTYAGNIAVPMGVGIVGTSGAASTIVDGRGLDGTAKTRGISSMGNGSYVQGLTFQYCTPPASNYGGGVCVNGLDNSGPDAAIIDCVVDGCYSQNSSSRGVSGQGGTWIRCLIKNCESDIYGGLYEPRAVIDCVTEGSLYGDFMDVVNTSIFGYGIAQRNNGIKLFNVLGRMTNNSATYASNTVATCGGPTYAGPNCVFSAPAESIEVDANYRPTPKAYNAHKRGKASDYNDFWPANWKQFKTDKDINGNNRFHEDGSIDAGACLTTALWESYADDSDGDDTTGDGSEEKPFKTITRAVAQTARGGTVHCAAGDYSADDGITENATYGDSVVYVDKPYLTIVADEGAEATFITGRKGTDGVGGVRCVLAHQTDTVIQGFTIRQGGQKDVSLGDNDKNAGTGIYGIGNGFAAAYVTAVDCRFTDFATTPGSGGRGVAGYCVNFVRCFVDAGLQDRNYFCMQGGSCYNSVFLTSTYTWSGQVIVNCTYVNCFPHSNGYLGSQSYTPLLVYNTFVYGASYGGDNNAYYYNSYVTGSLPTNEMIKAGTVVNAGTAAAKFDTTTYLPNIASPLIDAGSDTLYAEKCPEAYQGTDYFGAARVYNGGQGAKIDIGAGEFRWNAALLASDFGANVTVEDVVGEDQQKLTIARRFNTPTLCTGFTFNGTAVEFGDYGTDHTWVYVVDGDALAQGFMTAYATNQTAWYVAETGDDDNYGYHAKNPLRSVAKALTKAQAGGKVYVAEGTYDGGFTIDKEVGVEATGTRANTIIDGQYNGDTASPTGTFGAILTRAGAYVKGLTFQNCYTNTFGAGVRVQADAAVIDCAFFNCYCVGRGGACAGGVNGDVYGGTFIGCYFGSTNRDTEAPDRAKAFYAQGASHPAVLANCVFEGQGVFGHSIRILNSTLTGTALVQNNEQTPTVWLYNSTAYQFSSTIVSTNSVFLYSDKTAKTVADDRTLFRPKASRTVLDGNYRPVQHTASVYVDRGDVALYNELFPTRWEAYKNFDYNGAARVGTNGKMDIGAGQHTWTKSGSVVIFH